MSLSVDGGAASLPSSPPPLEMFYSSAEKCTVIIGDVDSEVEAFTGSLLWKDELWTLLIIGGARYWKLLFKII